MLVRFWNTGNNNGRFDVEFEDIQQVSLHDGFFELQRDDGTVWIAASKYSNVETYPE